MSVLSQFAHQYGRPYVRALLGYSIITNLMILAPSFHMLQVYDRVLASGSGATLFYITLIVLFALIVYAVAESARQKIANRLAAQYSVDVAQKMFAQLAQQPQGSPVTGRALRDYGTVKQFLASKTLVALFDLPFIPLFLLLLYFVHPTVALLTVIGIGVMCFIGYLNHKATEAPRADARKAEADATGFAQSSFSRGEDVRSLGMLPNLISIWGVKSSNALVAAEQSAGASAGYYALGKAFRQMLQVLLMAWGAWLVLAGNMSGGMIFLCTMISGKALGPIEQLIGGWESLAKAKDSYLAVEDLTGSDKSISKRPPLPDVPAHLSVDKLLLTADGKLDGHAVVKGVSFEIRPGEMVMIVGATGVGKSALARLVAGAVTPTAGEVRLGGAPRDRWSAEQWGRSLGYASDDASFFPGSVAANIARFEKISDLSGVYEATRRTGVHEMILRLPQGYQTNLGDGSVTLSSGQRQMIALARAFYGNPKLFVLDQPNAVLDQAGESALVNGLMEAKKRGAAILVVSKPNALLNVTDRAFVMQGGALETLHIQREPAPQPQPAAPPQPHPQPPANAPRLADMAARMAQPLGDSEGQVGGQFGGQR